jgi:hypothetical protein
VVGVAVGDEDLVGVAIDRHVGGPVERVWPVTNVSIFEELHTD